MTITGRTRKTQGIPGGMEGLRKRVLDLDLTLVKVGVPGSSIHKPKPGTGQKAVSLAKIAATHEFGNPARGIPERSFLRASILFNRKKYVRASKVLATRVLEGKLTSDKAYGLLGQAAQDDVKAYIGVAENFKPLKQSTIDAKGSSAPLIDSSQLRQSIIFVLENKE